ncbi:D-aminoacyl-tRNA deacylase [Flavobacteriaceae bacterium]|nr:D-aminoacyl-tRNA deacylase [Flavobacteriaceae bacterium]MDB0069609.1 D-aminoacyl-tRNA deacylase [Flavobacteriaceae bacterium]MDB4092695.1 D-aminoacyl-tRNA deacylase [Flavobacteriaceae bacterium]MDB4164409.1 D-aminoacyl-tRNA deacylase [Flavobacteriaceae bacterium]MDB9793269.1 D-aminoacyl-tRNA deacylase [Flavobacteriaceae bacterium]
MRVLIQRVKKGSVEVDNEIISKINQGIVLFVGIENTDDNIDIEWICKKVSQLRIFDDFNSVMNKSLIDIEGDILIISQFTLHASTKKGNRPSYIKAAKGDFAKNIYDKFLIEIKSKINKEPKAGVFGADMLVKIENDGPVTIFMDSKNKSF